MQLKRWDTEEVIFEMECATFRELVEGATKEGISFYRADMSYADMSGADMSGADISYADISYADMSYANMRGANMSGANMSSADMRGADMRGADMSSANMSGANMSSADMRGADMSYAVGNMEEVKSMQLEKYMIAFTSDILCIGCQQHTIEDWFGFTDDRISKMDRGALEWWKKWKDFIFTAIEMTKGA